MHVDLSSRKLTYCSNYGKFKIECKRIEIVSVYFILSTSPLLCLWLSRENEVRYMQSICKTYSHFFLEHTIHTLCACAVGFRNIGGE